MPIATQKYNRKSLLELAGPMDGEDDEIDNESLGITSSPDESGTKQLPGSGVNHHMQMAARPTTHRSVVSSTSNSSMASNEKKVRRATPTWKELISSCRSLSMRRLLEGSLARGAVVARMRHAEAAPRRERVELIRFTRY
jgi:hypothetical protein